MLACLLLLKLAVKQNQIKSWRTEPTFLAVPVHYEKIVSKVLTILAVISEINPSATLLLGFRDIKHLSIVLLDCWFLTSSLCTRLCKMVCLQHKNMEHTLFFPEYVNLSHWEKCLLRLSAVSLGVQLVCRFIVYFPPRRAQVWILKSSEPGNVCGLQTHLPLLCNW